MNMLNGVNTIAKVVAKTQTGLEEKVRVTTLINPERILKIQERVERYYSFKREENPSACLIALETLRLSLRQGINSASADSRKIRRLERAFWKKSKDGSLETWYHITKEQVNTITPEIINYCLASAVVTRKLPKNFLGSFIKNFLVEVNFE